MTLSGESGAAKEARSERPGESVVSSESKPLVSQDDMQAAVANGLFKANITDADAGTKESDHLLMADPFKKIGDDDWKYMHPNDSDREMWKELGLDDDGYDKGSNPTGQNADYPDYYEPALDPARWAQERNRPGLELPKPEITQLPKPIEQMTEDELRKYLPRVEPFR